MLPTRRAVQLAADPAHGEFGGGFGDEEGRGDLAVGPALRDAPQHITLPAARRACGARTAAQRVATACLAQQAGAASRPRRTALLHRAHRWIRCLARSSRLSASARSATSRDPASSASPGCRDASPSSNGRFRVFQAQIASRRAAIPSEPAPRCITSWGNDRAAVPHGNTPRTIWSRAAKSRGAGILPLRTAHGAGTMSLLNNGVVHPTCCRSVPFGAATCDAPVANLNEMIESGFQSSIDEGLSRP